MGVTTPSPIQESSVAPVTAGVSCLIHAETGSGKTLCYLLPLLKRLLSANIKRNIQAIIVVPSKELAVQVAADIYTLVDGSAADISYSDLVHLCITSSSRGLDCVSSPIVLGTPVKIINAMRSSISSTFAGVRYVVLDEVDRLIAAVGKYGTTEDKKRARAADNPTELILFNLLRSCGGGGGTAAQLQVVGVSATIGRPLRREMSRIVTGGESFDAFPVIRAGEASNPSPSIRRARDSDSDSDGEKEGERAEEDEDEVQCSRVVGIPASIRHLCVMVDCEPGRMPAKMAVLRAHWRKLTDSKAARRGLLFVPTSQDVKQMVGMLRAWGLRECKDLQTAVGINTAPRPVALSASSGPVQSKSKIARAYKNDDRSQDSESAQGTGRAALSSMELIQLAQQNRLGASSLASTSNCNNISGATSGSTGSTGIRLFKRTKPSERNSRANTAIDSETDLELFVASVTGTRGLHLQDVEYVFIAHAPRTMDEYLHMAGRTGRRGNRDLAGTVVSLVTFDELKRLQSWQVPLGIHLEVTFAS